MKFPSLLLFLFAACSLGAQDRVLLTGLLDGTLSGATPRAVELYVDGTVDLADYTLQRYANGSSDATDIALTGTYTDAFVYVVNGTEEFAAAFGGAGDFGNLISSGTVSGNGNDAFALVRNGTVIDVVGGPIGGPAADIYQDSYLYRQNGTTATGNWMPEDWDIPGNDLLDNLDAAAIGQTVPFGTFRAGSPGPVITLAGTGLDEAKPEVTGGFTLTLPAVAEAPLVIAYELHGSATRGVDYTVGNDTDTVRFAAGQQMRTIDLTVADDDLIEGTETIELRLTYLSDSTYSAGTLPTVDILDNDLGTDPIAIHIVQGSGFTSPLAGSIVTVEAVVTADFRDGLDGFYLQEEEEDTDGDPMTSEGIFVYAPDAAVGVGDLVTVVGEVEEYFGQTQLNASGSGRSVTVADEAATFPVATVMDLPLADSILESLEGMLVQPQDLVITNVNNLLRFGEVEVTSEERLVQFTECNDPDPLAYAAYLDSLERDVIILDDARSGTNLQPVLLPDGSTLSAANSLRAGQAIANLTGVLGYGFDRYRIQPTDRTNVSLTGNERPTAAPEREGGLRVVSANVLNYFTTLGSRGADTESELVRQEAKIVAALDALDAEIIGLIEIENNGNLALQRLVDSLNAVSERAYAYVEAPDPGDDEIMVALIYDTLSVAEVGTAASLTEPEDVFRGPRSNRVPLAQSFARIASQGIYTDTVTVCVNHFKSKGSDCGTGDDDPGGAGNCNGTRTEAAAAVARWLAGQPTGVATPYRMIIGDLNSYRREDPIDTLLAAGYLNAKTLLEPRFPCGGGPPSYTFQGYWGSLDYALVSDTLADHVAQATAWTVNAPEPEILDYNQEGSGDSLYAEDFYRFSDHDPIVVDLTFNRIIDATENPGTGLLPVRLDRLDRYTYRIVGAGGRSRYQLTSVGGQVLRGGQLSAVADRVQTLGLSPGVYFLTVSDPGRGQRTFKVIAP